MKIDNTKIKKILVVSLTNIGDVILTFPVVDILKRDFPKAELSIVTGPKAETFFNGNDCFKSVHVFDKHQPLFEMIKWVFSLRKERFDLVVDLRNTAIGFFVSPKYRTPFHSGNNRNLHMKEKHLKCLGTVLDFDGEADNKVSVSIHEQDIEIVDKIIREKIGENNPFVVIAPGAADGAKRWDEKKFSLLADTLIREYGAKIVFVGASEDRDFVHKLTSGMKNDFIDLCGNLTLIQLSALLKKCVLLIGNDSAPMHLASYLDVPVVALFGPTPSEKYGPWSKKSACIKKNIDCFACREGKNAGKHTCMNSISTHDVMDAIKRLSLFDHEKL